MFIMFVYDNGKCYNGGMGIRGDLTELHKKATEISKKIFTQNPHAEVSTKILKYI